jgi:hypothetical protein
MSFTIDLTVALPAPRCIEGLKKSRVVTLARMPLRCEQLTKCYVDIRLESRQ